MKAFDIVQSNDKYVYSQIPLTSVASSLNNYTNAYGLPEGSNHPKVGAVIYNGTDSFNGGVDLKDTPTLLDTELHTVTYPKTKLNQLLDFMVMLLIMMLGKLMKFHVG